MAIVLAAILAGFAADSTADLQEIKGRTPRRWLGLVGVFGWSACSSGTGFAIGVLVSAAGYLAFLLSLTVGVCGYIFQIARTTLQRWLRRTIRPAGFRRHGYLPRTAIR